MSGGHLSFSQRRDFLKFLGASAGAAALSALALPGCTVKRNLPGLVLPKGGIAPTMADALTLAPGLDYRILASWGDEFGSNLKVGFNNDYIAYLPFPEAGEKDGFLWVNFEYVDPYFVTNNRSRAHLREKEQTDLEKKNVGGAVLHVRTTDQGLQLVKDSEYNRRFDGFTQIPFCQGYKILGKSFAEGTLGNCAGGVTPWNTFLSCEENYYIFVREVDLSQPERPYTVESRFQWEKNYDMPPEHYGWVVEVDPRTGGSKKLISLGRFAHESATVTQTKDGRPVVYSGDDKADECIYKFIGDQPGNLDTGTLYVADVENGKWVPLTLEHEKLKGVFTSELDLKIQTRRAAHLAGGTPMNRPEDIAIHPLTGEIYVACTGNIPKGDLHGSIWRFVEKDGDPGALEFKSSPWITGGPEMGFSNPDNVIFDSQGNFWFTTDISENRLATDSNYKYHGNNGLFIVPVKGPHAGQALRVAVGPVDSELTGPWLTPGERSLLLAIQHPGARSQDAGQMTSHWPLGGDAEPKPSVVEISGDTLQQLIQGEYSVKA